MIYIFHKFNFRARSEQQIAKTKIQRGDDSFTARGITVSTNTRSRQKNYNFNTKSIVTKNLLEIYSILSFPKFVPKPNFVVMSHGFVALRPHVRFMIGHV